MAMVGLRYDTIYLVDSQKLMGSQLGPLNRKFNEKNELKINR